MGDGRGSEAETRVLAELALGLGFYLSDTVFLCFSHPIYLSIGY